MKYNQEKKVRLKLFDLQKKIDKITVIYLMLKVDFIYTQELESIESNDDIFILDFSPEIIQCFNLYQKKIDRLKNDPAGKTIETKNTNENPEKSILGDFYLYDKLINSFFDLTDPVYKGICPFNKNCLQKQNPYQQGDLLYEIPCITSDCPIYSGTTQFIPSKMHCDQLTKLREKLRNYSDYSELQLSIELEDNHSDLHKIQWKKIEKLIPDRSPKIYISKHLNTDISNEKFDSESEFSLCPYNDNKVFKILIIYLNKLQKKEKDNVKFIKESEKKWDDFDHNNRWVKVDYLKYPDPYKLRDTLKKSYNFIIIVGHGPNGELIQLNPSLIEQIDDRHRQIGNQFLVDSLVEVPNLQAVCFLSCKSDILARQLQKKFNNISLIIAFHNIIEIKVIPEFENALIRNISRERERKVSLTSVVGKSFSDIMTNSDISSISLNSVEIYHNYNLPLFLGYTTHIINNKSIEEIPEFPINPPEPNGFFSSLLDRFKNNNLLKNLLLILICLFAYLFYDLSNKNNSKQNNTVQIPKNSVVSIKQKNADQIIQNSVVSINVSNAKKPGQNKRFGGLIIGKIIDKVKTKKYKYYILSIRNTLFSNSKNKLEIYGFDKPKNVKINAKFFKVIDNFSVITFDLAQDIQIPYVESDDDDANPYSTITTPNELLILGYSLYSVNSVNYLSRTIKQIDISEVQLASYSTFYSSKNGKIEPDLIGSPIYRSSTHACILGLHFGLSTDKNTYSGRIMDNIKLLLKQSGDGDLRKISEDLKSCPHFPVK